MGEKLSTFLKVEDHLIQKRGKQSIICLVYSQRLHCLLDAESFLVWQPKMGESLDRKHVLNTTKLLPAQ